MNGVDDFTIAQKQGKWILVDSDTVHGKCSECGFEARYYEDDVYGYDYCPNCGARLSGEYDY